jgi:hypothetical protein
MPPAKQTQIFIAAYVNTRDLAEAAALARLDTKWGRILYKEPKVRAQIDRKINLIDVEDAKLKAQSNKLTADILDAALVQEVLNKKGGQTRIRAIELGYRRKGLMREGEFYVAPDPVADRNAPSMYGSRQTTLRRTVTEEVTHTEPAAPPPPTANDIFTVREY